MNRNFAGFARSGAFSLLAQAVQVLGSLVLSVVIVRQLDPQAFGVLSVARQVSALTVILSGAALERAALRFLPEFASGGDARRARRLILWSSALRGLLWGVCVLVALIWLRPLSDLLGGGMERELAAGVITAIFYAYYNYFRATATARFATATVAWMNVVSAVLTLLLTVWLLERGHGILGVLWGAAIGSALATIGLVAVSKPRAEPNPTPRAWSGWGRVRRYTLAFSAIALLNHIVHSQTEIYFLSRFHGPEIAGFYQLGFAFAQRIVDFLPLALWEVSMAGFSHVVVASPERLPAALRAYLVLLYLLLAPIASLGFAFAGSAIELLYGADMIGATVVCRAYFAIALVTAFNAPVGMIVYARERTTSALWAYLFFALVNLLLNLILIPPMGIAGALISIAVAKLLNVALFARIAWGEVAGLNVPWAFLLRIGAVSAPALLWLLVESRLRGWLPLLVGFVVVLAAMWLAARLVRPLRAEEAELVARTRLPMHGFLLRALGAPAVQR
jgi:O-antigen/teichoic acid export membrane protein